MILSSTKLPTKFRCDLTTGHGAIGVEFAGTNVTSTTRPLHRKTFKEAVDVSSTYVRDNLDLQWSEGFFRGFFTLEVTPQTLNAIYYSMKDVSEYFTPVNQALPVDSVQIKGFRNLDGFAIANFVVNIGENRLARPVAGGKVFSGALKSQVID
ncbi:hypothetical protein D9756_002575 [Leucocoprinus leucothites]|uniref:Uncharacterized protein n=1 Tax=Leucocoprinus leucothites TaxID=201217 RepID=A0A8H5GB21_9AGAR|nr:hypothetical protein D9756_002575 [Leucoagaricus leucothites]